VGRKQNFRPYFAPTPRIFADDVEGTKLAKSSFQRAIKVENGYGIKYRTSMSTKGQHAFGHAKDTCDSRRAQPRKKSLEVLRLDSR